MTCPFTVAVRAGVVVLLVTGLVKAIKALRSSRARRNISDAPAPKAAEAAAPAPAPAAAAARSIPAPAAASKPTPTKPAAKPADDRDEL